MKAYRCHVCQWELHENEVDKSVPTQTFNFIRFVELRQAEVDDALIGNVLYGIVPRKDYYHRFEILLTGENGRVIAILHMALQIETAYRATGCHISQIDRAVPAGGSFLSVRILFMRYVSFLSQVAAVYTGQISGALYFRLLRILPFGGGVALTFSRRYKRSG